jgi:hypothetical protein
MEDSGRGQFKIPSRRLPEGTEKTTKKIRIARLWAEVGIQDIPITEC